MRLVFTRSIATILERIKSCTTLKMGSTAESMPQEVVQKKHGDTTENNQERVTEPCIVIPDTAGIINIEMLNNLEICVLFNKEDHEFVLGQFGDEVDCTWGSDSGLAILAYDQNGLPFFILSLREHSRRVINHECVHMTHHICEVKGIPISADNSEVIAYLTDFLIESTHKCLELYIKENR